jgi:hypothetical protein
LNFVQTHKVVTKKRFILDPAVINLHVFCHQVKLFQLLFYFLRLHEKFPWYPEQLSFLLVNTDNNGYLSKQELMEASKVSQNIIAMQVLIHYTSYSTVLYSFIEDCRVLFN